MERRPSRTWAWQSGPIVMSRETWVNTGCVRKHKCVHNIFCGAFGRVEQTGTIHILRRRRKKRTCHACVHRCLNHVQFASTYEGGPIWSDNIQIHVFFPCLLNRVKNPNLCTSSRKKDGIGPLVPCSVNPTIKNISLEEICDHYLQILMLNCL